MLAHYYYYCLHFAYHLKGEAKHIGSRPLNTPLQRPESPAPVAQDRRRGDAHIVGYYAPATGGRAKSRSPARGGCGSSDPMRKPVRRAREDELCPPHRG